MPEPSVICDSCSTPLPAEASFCSTCGNPTPARLAGIPPSHDGEAGFRHRLQRALGDDYGLGELIGRGGFGVVYAARDRKLEREVAVKALRFDVLPTPELLERLQREARAVAKLRHPNVIPIYGVGEGEALTYMIMPRIQGESLRALLERDGPLAPDDAVPIAMETASALEAAHRKGIIHRDVKPENILLEGDERRVLLTDFGIAKAATGEETGMTGTGLIVGSPAYMSPEQAAGAKDVDGRSDVYSLGAVTYEMLSGRLPLPAESLHELVYKQVTEEPPDLVESAPAVPHHVARAVMRCLASDREDRWQTAADFRRALAAGDGTAAVPVEAADEEEESWLSRRGPYVLLLAFLLYFIRFFAGEMEGGLGPEVYDQWAGSSLLALTSSAVLVLLVAAGADLLVRVGVRLHRGHSRHRLARYLLGQPAWWQTWYPRALRVRDSVWDRLPFSMKMLRTLVWLELIIVPAGGALVVLVVPTFQIMIASAGREIPLFLTVMEHVVWGAAYAAVATAALLLLKFRDWRREHGIPRTALLGSLFNLRGSYWQGSPARAILRD